MSKEPKYDVRALRPESDHLVGAAVLDGTITPKMLLRESSVPVNRETLRAAEKVIRKMKNHV